MAFQKGFLKKKIILKKYAEDEKHAILRNMVLS